MEPSTPIEPSMDDMRASEIDRQRAMNIEQVARLRHRAARSRARAARFKHRAAVLEDRARKFESRATRMEASEELEAIGEESLGAHA